MMSHTSKPVSGNSGFHAMQTSCILALLVFAGFTLQGQVCVSGKVTDALTGKGIEGVSVSGGKAGGVITGPGGTFRLCKLGGDKARLVFTHLSYQPEQQSLDLKNGPPPELVIRLLPVSHLMDEIVITATRTEHAILDIPVRVNLITARQIEQLPAKNLDEVLQVLPGMNVNRPFGIFSTKATVTMRGMSGKEQARVLVLVDGIPANKSDGGTVDWNQISPALVEKIEVTKGAGSSLYGSNAMGGIINLITRRPPEQLTGTVSAEYGTFNTAGGRFSLGKTHRAGKTGHSFFWLANAFYRQSDGYITQSEADRKANPYIVESNMKELSAMLKAGYSFNDKHRIEARFNLYDDDRGTGEIIWLPEGNTTEHDAFGATLTYRGKTPAAEIRSSAYLQQENYRKVNEYLKDDYTWYDVLSVRRDLGWINTVSGKVAGKHLLTGGAELKLGSVDASDRYYTSTDVVYNKGNMLTSALFVQDEWKPFHDRVTVVAGLRYDVSLFYDGSFRIEKPTRETAFMNEYQVPDMKTKNSTAVSPRITVQYKWKATDRIYVLYSQGFRPSVLDDLCRSGRIKGGFKIANPLLEPEFLYNFETGTDFRISESIHASLSAYYSRGKDFLYYVSNGQTIDMGFGDRPIFIRANISKATFAGTEAEIRYTSGGLSLFANYAFSHAVIADYRKIAGNDTIDLTGKSMTDVPQHVAGAGGQWNNRILNASLSVRYNGSMWINDQNIVDEVLLMEKYPDYITVDLRCWKEIKKHYRVSVTVQNLFDQVYFDSKEAVCPGRFITAELSYSF